jgi:hypothetical protein
MNKALLRLCREAAKDCEEQHDYMRAVHAEPENWFPHKWVLDAMERLNKSNEEYSNAAVQSGRECDRLRSERAKVVPLLIKALENDGAFMDDAEWEVINTFLDTAQ